MTESGQSASGSSQEQATSGIVGASHFPAITYGSGGTIFIDPHFCTICWRTPLRLTDSTFSAVKIMLGKQVKLPPMGGLVLGATWQRTE